MNLFQGEECSYEIDSYAEGALSPGQVERLRHLAGYAPHWFWWGPRGTERRDRKIPRDPAKQGAKAKTNDPTTAGTLEQALEAMRRCGGGGVGLLVNTASPGFVGVDLDNVIHAGQIHALGEEAIERFQGAYVEISPSGTGLRIFALGAIPPDTPAGSTAVAVGANGAAIKFEVYAAGGKPRFLRTTGAMLSSTVGAVGPCQGGLDWLAGVMREARGGPPAAAPDNDVASASVKGLDAGALSLDRVFEALSELRPDKDAEAVITGIAADVATLPRSKLAEAWRGNKAPWKYDWSTADLFIACEAIRRGAGSAGDVVEVWGASGLADREKFERKDYQNRTLDGAARSVLTSLQNKAAKPEKAQPVQLSEGLSEALALSGDRLTFGRGGRPDAVENTVAVLFRNDPDLTGSLGFNELSQRPERLRSWTVFDRGGCDKAGPLTDDDVTRVGMFLTRELGVKMDNKALWRGLEAAARDASFDPLADRLRELRGAWDGVKRVDTWLVKFAKIDDRGCEEYVSAAGRCFLVGAVARALSPGCQMDTVLAVEGAGGGGKSTLFKVLTEAVAPGLFADGVHDVSNATALVEGTGGKFVVELAELAGIRRVADVEALKGSLTRRVDTHRRPYDVLTRELPRRFVFVATTNRTEYLSDPSGALLRRFMPVRTLATETDPIDRDALAKWAPQLWGEAVAMYEAGAKWHLDESDGEAFRQWTEGRERRREDGAFHDELVELLGKWLGDNPTEGRNLADIAREVGDMRTVEGDQASRNRLADTLRSLGMESIKRGGVKRWHFTPDGANRAAFNREQTQSRAVATA